MHRTESIPKILVDSASYTLVITMALLTDDLILQNDGIIIAENTQVDRSPQIAFNGIVNPLPHLIAQYATCPIPYFATPSFLLSLFLFLSLLHYLHLLFLLLLLYPWPNDASFSFFQDAAFVSNPEPLRFACTELGLRPESLEKLLLNKCIFCRELMRHSNTLLPVLPLSCAFSTIQTVGKELTWSSVQASVASMNRDSLAKYLYSEYFDHLIDEVNVILEPPNRRSLGSQQIRTIGLLDIYGFEVTYIPSFIGLDLPPPLPPSCPINGRVCRIPKSQNGAGVPQRHQQIRVLFASLFSSLPEDLV
ncbi:unnamed protein product [Protopolystoma xenopodis]|uniref:Myosin motor domain-containing protein n=1 Tax=Protopolystoma xenopodis TaxID=117903 RepID=A0A3S5CEK9_9PLAT|nr:unnamed protein product [Protopolystoma xenopodis]